MLSPHARPRRSPSRPGAGRLAVAAERAWRPQPSRGSSHGGVVPGTTRIGVRMRAIAATVPKPGSQTSRTRPVSTSRPLRSRDWLHSVHHGSRQAGRAQQSADSPRSGANQGQAVSAHVRAPRSVRMDLNESDPLAGFQFQRLLRTVLTRSWWPICAQLFAHRVACQQETGF